MEGMHAGPRDQDESGEVFERVLSTPRSDAPFQLA